MISENIISIFLLVLISNEDISAMNDENQTNFYEDLKWRQNTVIFVISSEFTEVQRTVIVRAIVDIQKATCIKFKLRTDEDSYVKFKVSFMSA